MKTIHKGNNYDVCKLTDNDAYQLGAVGRFAVLIGFTVKPIHSTASATFL